MYGSPRWIRDLLARLHKTPVDSARVLQAEIAGLEQGLASAVDQIATLRTAAASAELSAMEAIRTRDDRLARAALLEHKDYVEKIEGLEADVTVLRAILAESREFLDSLPTSPATPDKFPAL